MAYRMPYYKHESDNILPYEKSCRKKKEFNFTFYALLYVYEFPKKTKNVTELLYNLSQLKNIH